MSARQAEESGVVPSVVSDNVAPYSKPEPSKVIGTLATVAVAVAEGLTFSRPLPMVKPSVFVPVPPSVLETVTS
jgi:hypothetical protein